MNLAELKERVPEYTEPQKRALIAISLFAVGFACFLFATTRGSAIAQETPKPQLSITPTKQIILVHVAGKVKKPDVYPLLQGSRVADAIKAAGGAKKGVELNDINLARVLIDGEQVFVGYLPEIVKSSSKKARAKFTGIININRGTKAEFDSLVGIGPVIAGRSLNIETRMVHLWRLMTY